MGYMNCSKFVSYETENGRYLITLHKNDTIDGYEYLVSVNDTNNLDKDEPIEYMIFDTYKKAKRAVDNLYEKYNSKVEHKSKEKSKGFCR